MPVYMNGEEVGIVNDVGVKEEIQVNVTPTVSSQTITPPSTLKVFNQVNVAAVTSNIDANIIPANIRAGVEILGVQGNCEPDKPDQIKYVTPTTYQQDIDADTGYELGRVVVEPVTNAIDANIQSGNIRDGVTILGVTGNYAGETPNLQSKSITITENETQVISPDSGYDGLSSVEITTNVKGGGSQEGYLVKVVDYDGTIIDEQWLDTGDTYTLPTPPVHERLTFQEWSCSAQIVNNTITVSNNDIIAGPIYTTTSGHCEFDIEVSKATGLTVDLGSSGDGLKNWGDGSSDNQTTHTYADYGVYTIVYTELPYSRLNTAIFALIEPQLVGVRISSEISSIPHSVFKGAQNLEYVTIPNTVLTIDPSAFSMDINIYNSIVSAGGKMTCLIIPPSCTVIPDYLVAYASMLDTIVIPYGVQSIGSYSMACAHSLKKLILPSTITSIGSYAFFENVALEQIILPENLTSIGTSAFTRCYSLQSIVIPQGVTTLNSYALAYCTALSDIICKGDVSSISPMCRYSLGVLYIEFLSNTAIPTLSSSFDAAYYNSLLKIVVPDALYDDWIVATNWVTAANYIYKESEIYPSQQP